MTRPTIAPVPVVSCAVADELSTTEQSSGRMAPDQTDSERCLFTGPCHHSSGHKRNPPRDDGGSPRSGEPHHPVGGCAPTIYRPCDVDHVVHAHSRWAPACAGRRRIAPAAAGDCRQEEKDDAERRMVSQKFNLSANWPDRGPPIW